MRWGIIGAGNIAHRFAKSLQFETEDTLYAISGRNQEKLDAFQKEFPCEKTYIGYDNLLNDENVDAIYLALPHGMHKEWAIKALEKKKPVLCEKPATISEEEMVEIKEYALKNQTLFMEAMKSRFTPAYKKIKEIIEEKELGELKEIQARIAFQIPKEMYGMSYHTLPKDGGGLLDSGIYCISVLEDFLKGEPEMLETKANYYNGVDFYVDSKMQFTNGIGEVEVAIDRSFPKNAEFICEKGSITMVDLHRPQTYIIHQDGKDEEYTIPYENDDFYSQIHHFSNLVKQGKTESDIMTYDVMVREAHILECIRNEYTKYNENDLDVLATQEKDLAYAQFNSKDALELGNTIAGMALQYDRPVAIRITRCTDGLDLFQYMMDEKNASNLKYMDGKRQSVIDTKHSSAWAYVKDKVDDSLSSWHEDQTHLLSGGAFPIYAGEEIVAIVQVSGLHEGKDHELIIKSIEKATNKNTTAFKKALG